MPQQAPIPKQFKITDKQTMQIWWSDGKNFEISLRILRGSCPCADCVDELSGQRRFFPKDVAEDIRPVEAKPVGRYAYQIFWSDGHSTGLYSYGYLRELCEANTYQE